MHYFYAGYSILDVSIISYVLDSAARVSEGRRGIFAPKDWEMQHLLYSKG